MIDKKKIAVEKCVYTVPVETRPDQKNLMMWVRLADLPTDLKLDPNARRADEGSKVAKEIIATLRERPESFWKLNGGIQMTARDVEVKDGRLVTLTMFDAEDDDDNGISDGVINGGHTYKCIEKVIADFTTESGNTVDPVSRSEAHKRLQSVLAAVVRVEVLTGIERDELADISRARNTGEAVKKYSLQNLRGLYEPIKHILGPDFCKNIGFCENDIDLVPGKTFQVIDLVRLMSLFNNGLYPCAQDRHPVVCYSSAGRLVEKWDTEADTYKPLVPKLRDLMNLHDAAYVALCSWQEEQKGRPRNGFEKREQMLPFTGMTASYRVSAAFTYPLLASLRVLLTPTYDWKIDPLKFLAGDGRALIGVLMAFYDEQCRAKPHELGRSAGSWRAVAAEARARFAEQMLAKS